MTSWRMRVEKLSVVFMLILMDLWWLVSSPASVLEDDTQQLKAISDIENAGGAVDRDRTRPEKPVIGVSINNVDTRDVFLFRVNLFPHLRRVYICDTEIPNGGLSNLAVVRTD